MGNKILVFFDLETTGLDAETDDVIEIGAIKTKDNEVIEKFHSLIKPRKGLTKFITNLTGITEEELKDAKDANEIKEPLNSFIKDYPLIAHNASFDKTFLEKLLSRPLDNLVFDTLELSRIFFPDMSSHSLQNLVKQLSITKVGSHRALGDTEMLLSLYRKILSQKDKFPKKLLKTIKEIIEDTNYDELLGDKWEDSENDEDFSLFGLYSPPPVGLPFAEKGKSTQFENGVFYVDSPSYQNALDETMSLAKSGNKVVISIYSNELIDHAETEFSSAGLNVERIVQAERMLCPKKVQYFLDHRDYIPRSFRAHFAILISYIYKTKNLLLDNAPTHILKNPLLKLLSTCDESFENCSFKNQCPFFYKHSRIASANVVLCNHQFIIKDTYFDDVLASGNLVLIDAFRLPKIIYNSRLSYSYEELSMLTKYYGIGSEGEQLLKIIFDSIESSDSKDYSSEIKSLNKIFSGIRNDSLKDFFSRETYYIDRRGSRTAIVGGSESAKKVFHEIGKIYNSILFFSFKNTIGDRVILKEFTGIEGRFLTLGSVQEHKNVISIAPLYLSSSYNGTFIAEFMDFFSKVHREKSKAAIIFNQQNLLKEVYFEMKNKGINSKAIGIDLAEESEEIEMFLYDYTPQKEYDEVYFVRLPSLQSENYINESFEYFSALIIRNVAEMLASMSESAKLFFYLDSKLKRVDFGVKFEDLFATFPLFLEKEESVMRMLKTWSSRHIATSKESLPFKFN